MHIEGSTPKRTYKAIYRLLDSVSPIDDDCGRLCGAICCNCSELVKEAEKNNSANAVQANQSADSQSVNYASPNNDAAADEEAEVGIYLLPGEEKLLEDNADMFQWNWDDVENDDFPESWEGEIAFIDCTGLPCNRRFRPIQCRTYPVLPHYLQTGELVLIFNDVEELPYSCPLIEEPHKYPLNYSFLKATLTAWKHLARDPLIHDYIEYDSSYRFDDEIAIVFRG